jgi:hypothetical protein
MMKSRRALDAYIKRAAPRNKPSVLEDCVSSVQRMEEGVMEDVDKFLSGLE